jgi:hypothetical protein
MVFQAYYKIKSIRLMSFYPGQNIKGFVGSDLKFGGRLQSIE